MDKAVLQSYNCIKIHTKETKVMAQNVKDSTDMIHGSIARSILLFSIPLLVGNFFQQLYNTVDAYVVGNYVNTSALAAVGASTPIVNMLVGFFTGLAAGAGVVISQYFGGGRTEQMRRAIHSSLALTAILSVLFTALGLSFTKPLLHAIGVPEDVMPNSALYLSIYFWGMTFSLFYNMGSGILRAIGDSKNPLFYLIAASLVNIVLDFLFVCGFGMGVEGAAIATIIAQAVSAALVFFCTPFELVVRQTLCIVCFAPLSSLAPIYTDRCHGDTALASFTNSVSIAVSLVIMLALGLGFVL